MVLSEEAAQARLDALRRRREVLDRAITDLSLYLELGRRLNSMTADIDEVGQDSSAARAMAESHRSAGQGAHQPSRSDAPAHDPARAAVRQDTSFSPASLLTGKDTTVYSENSHIPNSIADLDPTPLGREGECSDSDRRRGVSEPAESERSGRNMPISHLSEHVRARRQGRALLEAALAVLEDARRPLHAGEIFSILSARGYTVPGRDPVAALNTRLWKRAVRGGRLRRRGDAVYSVANEDQE